ncbi:WAT1-related protein At4g30420 [Cucurbita maxima]|uniref:WAT1-related protein n=1 Tax=Cucurbita maxima TaxID=3661 RepID=A0A6J1IBK9_CUCMA|nr:WAT1-related protein At4g30420 [Cucurbita maxima]XP_022973535.1 WAT1-related protein At4g30420 [Cucurbita maxima]XP_022973539.1 WAT1-related protein At4g30420 [Cucurbita maxima]XP_022973545.1 WAT1-related protein At4g30420 [Cucurbita maxima]
MGRFEDYKPALAMLGLQCIYSALAIFSRAALVHGMSPRVFVVYRNAISTIAMAPAAFISARKSGRSLSIGFRGLSLIFVTSLIGVTGNQNAYFEGLYLSSSSAASAIVNLIPAITFVMALTVGLEKLKSRSWRSVAKVLGTVVCVTGAAAMALIKGPKLLNTDMLPKSLGVFEMLGVGVGVGNRAEGDTWLIGCVLLFVGSCFWSFWIIMLVPISRHCPDHIISSTWMLFLAMFQAAIFTLLVDDSSKVWNLPSPLEFGSCLYAGISSALSFLVQAWCVSRRGPLFTSLFNPLCTVITTFISSLFLHEELYSGSVIGAIAVIIGLYIVLWGKAKDVEGIEGGIDIEDEIEKNECKNDLEQPLLFGESDDTIKCDKV